MPTNPTGGKSDLAKVVERQMRNWELARAQHLESGPREEQPDVADFVSISRTVASGGSEVGNLLGAKVGWPVFDRELLQTMAGDDAVRTRLYENMDERDTSWLEATLRWLTRGELRKDDYFYRLGETVLALARQGHAVFLGRAIDLVLPRDRGLRVRIVAPLEKRAVVLARRNEISEALARAELERIDRERQEFRRRYFGRTGNELTCHDLTINLERFTSERAVDLIIVALRLRGILT